MNERCCMVLSTSQIMCRSERRFGSVAELLRCTSETVSK